MGPASGIPDHDAYAAVYKEIGSVLHSRAIPVQYFVNYVESAALSCMFAPISDAVAFCSLS